MLNNHFQKQFDSNNCELLPEDIKKDVFSDFAAMSNIGIENDQDQTKFFMIRNAVPEIVLSIWNKKINSKLAQAIAVEVFKNRNEIPINTLLQLIEAIDLALKKMIPEELRPKTAYPQPQGDGLLLPQYDIRRWVEATKNIYSLMAEGYSKDQAENATIGNWETMEKIDYKNWLKFYKERVPEKYPKLASNGFFGGLPVDALRSKIPGKIPNPIPNGEGFATKISPGVPFNLPQHNDVSDVRDTIEKQRNKLIGRLNSAEKLLSNLDGQLFAGEDQELMLKMLQDLKRSIQVSNKRTVKSTLFEDQIFKAANYLKLQGNNKAAGFFYKIAQLSPSPLEEFTGAPPMEDSPSGEEPSPDSGNDGGAKSETHELLEEFFDNLKQGVSGDPLDTPKEREADKKATISLGDGVWLSKTAQLAPVAPQQPPAKAAPKKTFVSEPETPEGVPEDNTDDVIEAALSHVTVNDVITRLEMLVSVYNQREISRQLGILDIMMDRIGLASFFPALGEAMSKALEANQYIGSRLGEILAKVRGSVDIPAANDWIGVSKEQNPETANIRKNLQDQKAQEEKRKENRRKKEDAETNGQQTVPVGETAELREPARIERSPKIQTR